MSPTPSPQCSIALWRGYVTAQFYAWDSNDGRVLLLSPTFQTWRLPWQREVPLRVLRRGKVVEASVRPEVSG